MTVLGAGPTRIPRSGRANANRTGFGFPLSGPPGGYLVGSGQDTSTSLQDLELAYYGQGGPDVVSTSSEVTAAGAVQICDFDTTRMVAEIYCDDSSDGAVFIGGPGVQAVGSGATNVGLRINPGQGRIYDEASRSARLYAICASGQTALVCVMLTPRSLD